MRFFRWSRGAFAPKTWAMATFRIIPVWLLIAFPFETAVAQQPATDARVAVGSFFGSYCVACHGAEKQKGKVALHTLTQEPLDAARIEVWKKVLEQLEDGLMPPEDKKQPGAAERDGVIRWVRSALANAGIAVDEGRQLHPSRGNWLDHARLFGGAGAESGPAATPARLWRVSGPAYEELLNRINKQFKLGFRDYGEHRMTSPWTATPQWNFGDFASSHHIGEAEVEFHMRNATQVARALAKQTAGRKPSAGYAGWIEELNTLIKVGAASSPEQIAAATRATFRSLLGREPSADESSRYNGFLAANLKTAASPEEAAQMFLTAVLFQPEVLYRVEIPAAGKRELLEPRALARAIAFTLTDREPDKALSEAAAAGQLANAGQIRAQVQRMLNDDAIAKPRILGFFQEYFGYLGAPGVFKDEVSLKAAGLQKSSSRSWHPDFFVADLSNLIQWVIRADKQVLRELLTTRKTFVATRVPGTRDKQAEAVENYKDKPFGTEAQIALKIYEIDLQRADWSAERPFDMPEGHRMGVLTHPAWLIAQSGNFDNHAIHRGRWIRERLLGGRIPDVPITVNAMLPDEPHRTLRDRMRVVREEYCWNCHQQMDPLGLAFEQFDHLGRYRTEEMVDDPEATFAKENLNKNGQPRGKRYKLMPLDTTGAVNFSLDPKLNGPVKNPFELIERLAGSTHVEQVFVRHAFRYFVGRNETAADGPALVEAHRAYSKSDGSMKALIASLLSSDAFLYRVSRQP